MIRPCQGCQLYALIIKSQQYSLIRPLRWSRRSFSASAIYSKETLDGRIISGTVPPGGHGVLIGQYAELQRTFTTAQVEQFVNIVGDGNPIHRKDSEGRLTSPPHPLLTNRLINEEMAADDAVVVPGIFLATMFSSIFGTLIPGCVYLDQNLNFVRPVLATPESDVTARVTITKIATPQRPLRKGMVLVCDTEIWRQQKDNGSSKKMCVRGVAKVWLVHEEASC